MTKEELQLRWDEILIQARFFYMDMSLNTINVQFKNTYGVYPDEAGLLRCSHPTENGYYNDMSVLRFICGYLPKIADYCWKHTSKDWFKVLEVVNHSTHDTRKNMVDIIHKHRDRLDIRATQKAAARSTEQAHEFHDKCESYKLSNQWAVCK